MRDTEYLNDVIGICRRYLVLQVRRALVEMQREHHTDIENPPSELVAQNGEAGAPTGSATETNKAAAPTTEKDKSGALTAEKDKSGTPTAEKDKSGTPTAEKDKSGAPTAEKDKSGAPTGSVSETDKGGARLDSATEKTTFRYIRKFRKLTERLGPVRPPT